MSSSAPSWRPQLERARRVWRSSPLPRFFAWWGGELAALLPPAWRGAFGDGACWYLLARVGEHWQLHPQGRDEPLAQWPTTVSPGVQQTALAAAVAQVDPQDLRVALVLPDTLVLRRQLLLPLAAAGNLQQVGAYEMDRQTPFRAEQVYYAIRELPAAAPAGRFMAELVAVPRSTLDPLLAQLQAAGIAIDAVDMAQGSGRLGVNLLPPAQVRHRADPRRRINLALAAACALLLVLVLGQWRSNREQALAAMQAQVDSMHAEAQQVSALRQQLQDNAGAAGFLVQRKQRSVTMLSVLLELTERLPDSAWLERLSVDNTGQIGFQGQSKRAVQLVDALKGSRLIRDANFQGSIQPDPATGKDRFYMVAQLRQPAAAASTATPRAGVVR
jgi:general secretion pathway protein L